MDHVILYVHDLRSSGVVRNAIDYARRLARDYPTTLVVGHGGGMFAAEAGQAGCALVQLSERPLSRGAAAVRLRRWLRSQPGGVLMSIGNMGHPTVYWATRTMAGLHRVYHISNPVMRDDGWRSRMRRAWAAMLVRDAARVVTVGTAVGKLPLLARALASGRAVAINNGVDRTHALRQAQVPSPHAWLDEPVPTVLSVGRLRPQKNLDVLIEAVGIARRSRRLRLILIGGGTEKERARLTALATAAGLDDDFLLAGESDNVFAWVARATVFALPSRWEGSSIALLEALAVGTPVVAARQAGDAEQVLDGGRYGLLVDAHDAAGLATALLRQCSPDAIRPGDRADAFSMDLEPHVRLVASLLEG